MLLHEGKKDSRGWKSRIKSFRQSLSLSLSLLISPCGRIWITAYVRVNGWLVYERINQPTVTARRVRGRGERDEVTCFSFSLSLSLSLSLYLPLFLPASRLIAIIKDARDEGWMWGCRYWKYTFIHKNIVTHTHTHTRQHKHQASKGRKDEEEEKKNEAKVTG